MLRSARKILAPLCCSASARRVEKCAEPGESSMEGPSREEPISRDESSNRPSNEQMA